MPTSYTTQYIEIPALKITVALVRREAGKYVLLHEGERVGTICRRDSWRVHDWYAEFAFGDLYVNVSEERLDDCFAMLPYKTAKYIAIAKRHQSVRKQHRQSAARLRKELKTL